MTKRIPWLMAVVACLIVAACGGQDESPSGTHAGLDSGTGIHWASRAGADSGAAGNTASGPDTGTHAGSGGSADSGSGADPSSVDQTSPAGANGLAFDAEGMIWLADLYGNQVLRLDPTSGEILDRFAQDEAGPDDIAIDEQGRVFWTGWSNGQIGRIDPQTGEDAIIAQLPEGANSIAFSQDGRLFVGLVILNSGLYEIDPEGIGDPRLITDALGSLNAFEFGPDGFLYGPLEAGIVKIDVDAGEVVETITEGAYFAVRYDEKDNSLYGLTLSEDAGSPCLDKIDLADHSVSTFAQPVTALGDNFAIDARGYFYVTGFNAPQIAVIGADGSNQGLIEIGAGGHEE